MNFRNAVSIRALVSGLDEIRLVASAEPVSNPSSPPKKRPPAAKNVYVATSPRVVGLSNGVISGTGSGECCKRQFAPPEEGKSATCTCSAAGELYVRWSLRGFEGFEVLHSVGPEAVGEVDAQA